MSAQTAVGLNERIVGPELGDEVIDQLGERWIIVTIYAVRPFVDVARKGTTSPRVQLPLRLEWIPDLHAWRLDPVP